MNNIFYIKKSPMDGLGIFSKRRINPGEYISSISYNEFGRWLNHSEKYNNSHFEFINGKYILKAKKCIYHHDEITIDYYDRNNPKIFKQFSFNSIELIPKNTIKQKKFFNY